jgi:CRP/FNR family transcriptional regulator, cyclic AMP receptor protein
VESLGSRLSIPAQPHPPTTSEEEPRQNRRLTPSRRFKLIPVPGPVEILRNVGLFESLSDRDIKRLADAFKERAFSEGDVILSEGKGGVGFYVIGGGTVNYSVNGKEVGSGGPGDYFGEVALISDSPRSATVTAATEVTVYGMTLWDFRALVQENPEVASELLQVMAKRHSTES